MPYVSPRLVVLCNSLIGINSLQTQVADFVDDEIRLVIFREERRHDK
jgi:hypothetical protein